MREVKIIEPTKTLNGKEKDKKLKVAAYARVSTDSIEQSESYENQVRFYSEKIKSNTKYEFVEVYADQAISGTTSKRPAFQRMIKDAQDGKIDLILTKSISRFSRNIADLLHYIRLLKDIHVGVIFEEDNIRTDDSKSDLLLSILGAIAQMEIENTSSHIKWTMQQKMANGELLGIAPYGYEDYTDEKGNRKLKIKEDEAKVVKYIFKEYLNGKGLYRISRELESRGIKNSRDGKIWHIKTLSFILHNEKYTGKLLQGKSFSIDPISQKRRWNNGEYAKYELEDSHEAIISTEDFNKVQEILNSRTQMVENTKRGTTKGSNISIFTSKIKCSYCGSNYVRKKSHCKTNHEKVYWRCGKAVQHGKSYCPNSGSVTEDMIKEMFIYTLNDLLNDKDYFVYLSEDKFKSWVKGMYTPIDETIEDEIINNIETIQKRKNNLLDLLLDETIGKEEYNNKIIELDLELEKCEIELSKYREEMKEGKDEIRNLEEIYNLLKNQDKNAFNDKIFNNLVEYITIGGKREEDGKLIEDNKMIRMTLRSEALTKI